MDLILCHTTADFDAVGAAVGLTRLKTGGRLVLTGGAHPTVKKFLALHRDEFALIERRSVNPREIRSLTVVDTQYRDRLGKAAEWLDLEHLQSIEVYDHHLSSEGDIPATKRYIELVGSTTTLIVEQLQQQNLELTPFEAMVMALGIHVDTGSLTFDHTTPRDAQALTWLMTQGISFRVLRDYIEPGLSPNLQQLLTEALDRLHRREVSSYTIAWVMVTTEDFVPGLSSVVERLLDLIESDALLFAHRHYRQGSVEERVTLIGRSRIPRTNLNQLLQPLGGGGHPQAASVTLRDVKGTEILEQVLEQFQNQIPHPLTARDIMSSPVRTIRPETTIGQAQRILLRYGHSGLSVVNEKDQLMGIISRRDLDLALHHGFSHAPVKGYMTHNLKTITPDTSLGTIESLMVTYDIGRLPVVKDDQLLGIVTRTDVLRQLHQGQQEVNTPQGEVQEDNPFSLMPNPQCLIPYKIWSFLGQASRAAQKRGWHLYLVGGGVRDLMLAEPGEPLLLQDIDLVVDGFYRSTDSGAGVELAKELQQTYQNARLEIHGAFQTAALLWHNDPELGSLWVDIATARTEFYPYPAANPEVEASDLRQDLYRRDFTINALAIRLTPPRQGELLDFFGGLLDLKDRKIRVLHANSFIEDPTRIYRAVRFAVRLGFEIESQTEEYIRYAINSGVYERSQLENDKTPALQTRLKAELKYILEAPYGQPALQLLSSLGALRCLHPTLTLDAQLWWQIRVLDRCLKRFDPNHSLIHWQIRLEAILASVDPKIGVKVAQNLQMTSDSIQRLKHLSEAKNEVMRDIKEIEVPRPSEVVKLLQQYKVPTLVLLTVLTPRWVRRYIWRYLTDWIEVKPPLNGNDLKALGYKPGPKYRHILEDLLAATLDSEITTREEGEALIRERFDVLPSLSS